LLSSKRKLKNNPILISYDHCEHHSPTLKVGKGDGVAILAFFAAG